MTPSVLALRSHILSLTENDINRARTRGDADGRVETALRHFAEALLYTPTIRAHEHAASGGEDQFAAALRVLYGISPTDPAAPGTH